MLNDGDIDQQRHIRAAVGAIVASVVNDTALFVSGGAEHQGPDGGGMIALIAERASSSGADDEPVPAQARRSCVAGAGIAGSLIAAGPARTHRQIELICLERADRGRPYGRRHRPQRRPQRHQGPAAAHLPERGERWIGNSLPWRRWTISLTDGRELMDLDLSDVADNAGIRIRWAELYALLRRSL